MAFPTDTFTGKSGDLDSFIPNIWGSRINDFAKEVLKITPHTTDRSDELAGGGNTLYTPNMTEMSANQKVNASAVTLNFRGLLEKTLSNKKSGSIAGKLTLQTEGMPISSQVSS